jgi:hypothetical protein
MGHERIGFLPRSARWADIVERIADSSDSPDSDARRIVRKTLENVRQRFLRIHKDAGVQAAFAFFVAIATRHLDQAAGLSALHVPLEEDPSPSRLSLLLNRWIDAHLKSAEYAEIAKRAGADTIAHWTQIRTGQGDLFVDRRKADWIWSTITDARAFCEVSRIFFAKYTERYLKYFLEREASAQITSVSAREKFGDSLRAHVDEVSTHAFETARITQSFAAGWFNNHAKERRPSDAEIEAFLATAFGKIQEELYRETPE